MNSANSTTVDGLMVEQTFSFLVGFSSIVSSKANGEGVHLVKSSESRNNTCTACSWDRASAECRKMFFPVRFDANQSTDST